MNTITAEELQDAFLKVLEQVPTAKRHPQGSAPAASVP